MTSNLNSIRFAVVSSLGIAAAALAHTASMAPDAAAMNARDRVTWEYCRVMVADRCQGFEPTFDFSVAHGSKLVVKSSWTELASALGGTGKEKESVAVFDLLGRDGWELVATLCTPNPSQAGGILSSDNVWYFKRAKQ